MSACRRNSDRLHRPIWNLYFPAPHAISNHYAAEGRYIAAMEAAVWDAIYLLSGLGFFAAAIGYCLVCESL